MAERTPCRRRRGLFFSLLGGLIRFLTGRIVGTGIVYVDLLKSTCARAVGSLAKSAPRAWRTSWPSLPLPTPARRGGSGGSLPAAGRR